MSNVIDQVNKPLATSLLNAKRFTDDPGAVARAMRPVIEAGAAESEAIGQIVDSTVDAMAESGLLGLLVPQEFGGIEAEPEVCIDVIEELSYADGSFGWAFMATAFGTKGAATYTGPVCTDTIFKGNDGFLTASHIAPNGTAELVDGGYRISGRFQFGSGSQFASFFMGAFVLREDGVPVRNEDGSPRVLMVFAPRDQVVIDYSSWEVAGMRATASYDFEFVDQVVHEDFVMDPLSGRRHGGPPLDVSVSMGHVAVSLGITNRILDELKGLAQHKRRQGRATLIDQSTFQRDFGIHRALTDAARDRVRRVYRAWCDDAAANGTASLETRAHARLAACWATKVSTEVAHWAYNAAGSDGLRHSPGNRLSRCFRDIEAAAVHRHVDDNILIESAQVLLDVNSPTLQL
jgi:alkylation response protein AidB-like acyl-CoA dehydrogenase